MENTARRRTGARLAVALPLVAASIIVPLTNVAATSATAATTVPNGVVASDGFARTVSGGLGTADVGGTWSLGGAASNFSVVSGTASLKVPARGASTEAYLNGAASAAAETAATVSLDKLANGGGAYVMVIGRQVATVGSYRAKLRFGSDGSVVATIVRYGSTQTTLASATVPGLKYAAAQQLAVRFDAEGTSPTALRLRVWPTGTTEPTSWLITATDSTSGLQAAGSTGVAEYVSASSTNVPVTLRVSNLSVTEPVTLINGGAAPAATSTATSASFTLSSTRTPASFQCSLDGGAWAACTSPASYSGLMEGAHTFSAKAAYGSGSVTPVASQSWTVATVPPETTLGTDGPADGSSTTSTSASFSFTSSETGTFQCSLDSAAWSACTSPVSFSGLAVGSHTFQVRAVNDAGRADDTPAGRTWSVAAPVLAAPAPAPAPAPGTVEPDATNTGVPAGTTLTPHYGDMTITQDGTTLDAMDIHGFVTIKAKNVTITRSIIRGGQNPTVNVGLVTDYGYPGLVVQDSTLTPEYPSVYIDGIKGNNYTARRVNIYGTVDGAKIHGDNSTIEESYIHDLVTFASDPYQNGGPSHSDGIQILGGTNLSIAGNTIMGGNNSAIQVTQGYSAVQNAVVSSNWLDYGGCTVNLSSTPLASMAFTAKDNKFGRHQGYKNCAIITHSTISLTAGNNTWEDTGAQIALTVS